MSTYEFQQAHTNASSIIALLTRAAVPPEPLFYRLFYDYLVGVPDRSADAPSVQLRRHLNSGESLSDTQYQAFLEPYRQAEALAQQAATRLSGRLEVLAGLLGRADSATKAHAASLAAAVTSLESERLQAGHLRDLIDRLQRTNQRVRAADDALRHELDAARTDIEQTQVEIGRLKAEAGLDPLTGLANRMGLELALDRAIARSRAGGHAVAALMLDIDHFKQFNDSYGHLAGDEVLRAVGRALKATGRAGDTLARFGGDEFAAVLQDADESGAMIVAERMRQAVLGTDLARYVGQRVLGSVTTSIGVALLRRSETAASLMARADSALLAAKHAGRNRVVLDSQATTPLPVAARA